MGRCGCCNKISAGCRFKVTFVVFLKTIKDINLYINDPKLTDCENLNAARLYYDSANIYGYIANPSAFFINPPQFNIDICSTTNDSSLIDKININTYKGYQIYNIPKNIEIKINDSIEIEDNFSFLHSYKQSFKNIKDYCSNLNYERDFELYYPQFNPFITKNIINIETGNTFNRDKSGNQSSIIIKDGYIYSAIQKICNIYFSYDDFIIDLNNFIIKGGKEGELYGQIGKYLISSLSAGGHACLSEEISFGYTYILYDIITKNLNIEELIQNEKLENEKEIKIVYPILLNTHANSPPLQTPSIIGTANFSNQFKGLYSYQYNNSPLALPNCGITLLEDNKNELLETCEKIAKLLYEKSDSIIVEYPEQNSYSEIIPCGVELTKIGIDPNSIQFNDQIYELPAPKVKPNSFIKLVTEYYPAPFTPPQYKTIIIPIVGATNLVTFKSDIRPIYSITIGKYWPKIVGDENKYYSNFKNNISNYVDKCGNNLDENNYFPDISIPFNEENYFNVIDYTTSKPYITPNPYTDYSPFISWRLSQNIPSSENIIYIAYVFILNRIYNSTAYDYTSNGSVCDRNYEIGKIPTQKTSISLQSFGLSPSIDIQPGARIISSELYIDNVKCGFYFIGNSIQGIENIIAEYTFDNKVGYKIE